MARKRLRLNEESSISTKVKIMTVEIKDKLFSKIYSKRE